jgi:hypothetical protein
MTSQHKQLPDAITKKKFYDDLYSKVPDHILRKRINQIIYDFRKDLQENKGKTFKDIANTQTIYKPELLEYARTYFFPAGYKDEIES